MHVIARNIKFATSLRDELYLFVSFYRVEYGKLDLVDG